MVKSWDPYSYIDLLDAGKFFPRLIDERLVDGNTSRRHTSVDCLEDVKRLLKRSFQAVLLGDICLDVNSLAAKSRAP